MPLLWKYPCGCVGLGRPHAPRKGRKTRSSKSWDDVIVVRVCDAREWDGCGWLMPAPRLLEASSLSDDPVGLPEDEEESYFSWLREQRRDAENWNRTKTVLRQLMEVSDERKQ